jgi:hypothetical protein
MFISKQEKTQMQESITYLLTETSKLHTHIVFLTGKIKALEEKKEEAEKPKPKPTEEELKIELKKARQRSYARAYYQRKKERDQVLHVGS